MKRALIALAVLVSLAVAALTYLVVVYPNTPPKKGPTHTVAIEIPAQATLEQLAGQLTQAKLIERPQLFAWYARALGATERLHFGRRVLLGSYMTPRHILQRMAAGYGSTPVLITIPEGFNRFEVASRLAEWDVCTREDFLRADQAAPSVRAIDERARTSEGYLFPDTYWLRDGMQAEQVVARLAENAQRRLQKLSAGETASMAHLREEFGFGLREIVTLASIVEKEAHVQSEQPIIAAVFLNRLRDPRFRPKRLQADPTVAYGCLLQESLPSCAGFDAKHVTKAMLLDPQNVYNTYRLDGLPPSPIANPGLSALLAVLHPAEHGYFYFVARGDGRHTFSTSLDAHNLAVHADLLSGNAQP
jgi:UPF0755 protein